ncbi:MAG TPA: polyphosphate polymerase domain-containing protein [Flavobacteriales bacterium]|nr:polyphosphate polymerase domain-containing protein [Flavobacteriales bacterium]
MDPKSSLDKVLQGFAPISLAEMDNVQLLSRTDTKYVFAHKDLMNLLASLQPHYRCLEVDGERGSTYRSLYFDTPDNKSYFEHHNGRTFRNKVRFREYVKSGLCYLEVKRKTGRGDTDKARRKVASIPAEMSPEQMEYVGSKSTMTGPFEAKLWNTFTRITLVGKQLPERLTIDHDLRFSNDRGETTLEGICIAELKQARADRTSPFAMAMRERGYRPAGMSKYCVGMLLLDPQLKQNTFKEVLLQLQRLRRAA